MCLLVFAFGFPTCPLLVCSNRDECLSRPTLRGQYDSNLRIYAPRDAEAGGTWIAFSEINGRFVIVLNYHQWRSLATLYRYFFPPSNPLSRGALAMDFITSDANIKAQEYASRIRAENYTGFNLIVGDRSGCYYVSNAITSQVPLKPGRFYAISNGHLEAWDKSIVCKSRVEAQVAPYLNTIMNEETATELCHHLLQIMQCRDPLPDPTFGYWWPLYSHISAIFVDADKNTLNDFCTRTTTIAAAYSDGSSGKLTNTTGREEATRITYGC